MVNPCADCASGDVPGTAAHLRAFAAREAEAFIKAHPQAAAGGQLYIEAFLEWACRRYDVGVQ